MFSRTGGVFPARKKDARNAAEKCCGRAHRTISESRKPKREKRVDDHGNQIIEYRPVGVIHSTIKNAADAPRSPKRARGIKGTVEILPVFKEALADLDGFSHIVLICHLHLSTGYKLQPTPPDQNKPRGLFATRSPNRPNPIAVSVVKLEKVEGTTLHVANLDMVDGTPVLDIKPFIPDLDEDETVTTGWLDKG